MSDFTAPSVPASSSPKVGIVLLLGALTILAPLSIDMYLPALPTLARNFGVGQGEVQQTLTSYFVGVAVGQAFYGPVVDRFGRKPPLYFGMTLFTIVSFGCAFAPTIGTLIGLRLLQALGACAGGVVSRAMVRDLFAPIDAAKVYAMLSLVTGLGPLLSPLIGGYVLLAFGWRAIFVILGCATLVLVTVMHFRLEETHRPHNSLEARAQAFNFARVITGYWHLLLDRHYVGYGLSGAFALAGMFVYVAGGPFIIIELYHVPAQHFGLIFGANAIVMIAGSQINGRLVGRVPPEVLLRRASTVQCCGGLLLLAHGLTGIGGLWGFVVPLALYTSTLGFILSNSTILAMTPFGRVAGMASALLGTLQFVAGALASSTASAVHAASALPTTAGMAICAGLGLFANRVIVKPRTGTE